MNRTLVLAGAVGVAMAAVLGAVALGQRRGHPATSPRAGVTESAPARAAPPSPRRATAGTPPTLDLDALLADGSPRAWGNVASLYPGSDEPTKRKILQRIAELPDMPRVIGYLLATVGEDPTPPADDPLLEEASALLQHRLGKFEDYEYTRRTMLMQKTDKRRWVLADALIDYAKTLRDARFGALKGALQAKLIDLHAGTRDGFVRSGIVAGLRSLGARDAALILEKDGRVSDRELLTVAEEQAAAEKTLAESDAR